MLRFPIACCLLITMLLGLTGCWNKYELVELGFVLGTALDEGKDGSIILTTQIYRPSSGSTGQGPSNVVSNVMVTTSNATVFEAVRDIPIHLGRKAQWSHMRVVIISEQLAKHQPLGQLLDYFSRDHEPRQTLNLIITEGRAADLLKKRPMIEKTTSQQLLRSVEYSHSTSGKTILTSLLDVAIQFKSAHPDTVISFVHNSPDEAGIFSAAGLGLFKQEKLVAIMPAKHVQSLNMLRNQYKTGILEVACEGKKKTTETFEIIKLNSHVAPVWQQGKVASIHANIEIVGAIGEMKCIQIKTTKDEQAFIKLLEQQVKKQVQAAYRYMQKRQIEVIGIGNTIYRSRPKTWFAMKDEWDTQFSKLPLDLSVKVKIETSGTTTSVPGMSNAGAGS